MIELIYLENSLYMKSQLNKAYQLYMEDNVDVPVDISFEDYVNKAYTGVLNWCSFNKRNEDSYLNIINADIELAEDMLDAISALDIDLATEWNMYFKVQYIARNNSLIVEYDYNPGSLILPDPESYTYSYNKIRNQNLTKLARLLNVLRTSKVGKHG